MASRSALRASAMADDPAAIQDPDAVRQLHDLVQLRRDEHDGRTRVTLGDDLAVDELDAADVQSAGRLVEHEDDERRD